MRTQLSIFFILLFMLIGCKKEKINKELISYEKVNLKDTIRTGNKLPAVSEGFIKDDTHKSVGQLFLEQAEKGILKELKSNKIEYLNSYFLDKETLDVLIQKKPFKSLGIKLTLVKINSSKYNILNISPSTDSLVYFIASYVNEDGNLDPNNHHFIFNLKNNFNISNRISDTEFLDIKDQFKKDINDTILKKYNDNNDNTLSIYFGWGDIFDILNKKDCSINFQLAEIIDYNIIGQIVNNNPVLTAEKPKYEKAYKGKEKRLTILGEYKCPINDGRKLDSYFDMGSLYP